MPVPGEIRGVAGCLSDTTATITTPIEEASWQNFYISR